MRIQFLQVENQACFITSLLLKALILKSSKIGLVQLCLNDQHLRLVFHGYHQLTSYSVDQDFTNLHRVVNQFNTQQYL